MRQAEGGSARLDLTGVYFSITAPSPFPATLLPHLLVLLRCPPDHQGFAALEVTFHANGQSLDCLLYTSDAADDSLRVDLGGRRTLNGGSPLSH